MPARNIYKVYLEDTYYHVYNRGVNKEAIFRDEEDYARFISLLTRYLDASHRNERQTNGCAYPCYDEKVNLLAYCLLQNHFHMFLYQYEVNGMRQLLSSVTVAYSMYFNKKYKRVGPVFQQRYRAVRISDDAQLMHITRYIHLNPDTYESYKWSSYHNYAGTRFNHWLKPGRVLELFSYDTAAYVDFVADYKDKHDELELMKQELAG
ncbi:MAG: transposase [Candidatus Saccharimonas sp.]